MFPDEKASERPDISTWVTLVDACGVTATAPYADAEDVKISVAVLRKVTAFFTVDPPAGRVVDVKARRLEAAMVK